MNTHRSILKRLFARRLTACLVPVLVAGVAALAASAAPASAGLGLACPSTTGQPFVQWGDNANYAYAPNGGFESGATGWTLSGGTVVIGNEPFYLHSTSDRSSLSLPSGASATSPPMCISLFSGKMRFVARGTAGSKVKVQILYQGVVSSLLGILDGGTYTVGTAWSPSPQVAMLGGELPLLTSSVSFRFTAIGGTVSIDDVYLDPCVSR
jgi:hypothetical protein